MSYLDRLRQLDGEKHLPQYPSKPSKAPFEGYEGDQDRRVLENAPAPATDKRFPAANVDGQETLTCAAEPDQDREAAADFDYAERVAIMHHGNGIARAEADVAAAICVAPLAPGETIEQRERVIVHIGEYLDRRRRRGVLPDNGGDAA